jgi:hypothetical protein
LQFNLIVKERVYSFENEIFLSAKES